MSVIEIDVLCVGLATYDLVYSVDRHPGEDEKCFASGLVSCGGGPAANAAVTAARLGGVAAFAGYLGRDAFGEKHFQELISEGVITRFVVRGEHPTAVSSIIVKPGGKRAVITHKGFTPALDPGHVDLTSLRPKTILLDGHQPTLSIPLAVKAREQKIPVVLDAGSVHQGTVELAPLCDYLVASQKFALDFTGKKSPHEALAILSGQARNSPDQEPSRPGGPAGAGLNPGAAAIPAGGTESLPARAAVITLGEAGLVWASGHQSGSLEAFPVEAVDTTGAGDVFHGAFALAIARGEHLLSAMRYAAAAAALACTRMGARTAIPAKAEVEAILEYRRWHTEWTWTMDC